jgi:hypothetical protein
VAGTVEPPAPAEWIAEAKVALLGAIEGFRRCADRALEAGDELGAQAEDAMANRLQALLNAAP